MVVIPSGAHDADGASDGSVMADQPRLTKSAKLLSAAPGIGLGATAPLLAFSEGSGALTGAAVAGCAGAVAAIGPRVVSAGTAVGLIAVGLVYDPEELSIARWLSVLALSGATMIRR